MGQRIHGFPPVAGPDPRVLILGSMPSERSIEIRQYYGHPRNHFWEIIYLILERPLPSDYEERIDGARSAGIAIWDSIAGCRRRGSLDQAIEEEVYNDVCGFIARHPTLRLVVFNGRKAEQAFYAGVRQRKKQGTAGDNPEDKNPAGDCHDYFNAGKIRFARLPSTSPIPTRRYRRMGDKLVDWRIVADYLDGGER